MTYVINIQDENEMAAQYHISNNSTKSSCSQNGSTRGHHSKASDSSLGIWDIINPYFLHQWMPYFLFLEVTFMYFVGCFIALPRLYPETAYIHQVIGTFLVYQIVVNWWFIHVTDSSFNTSVYPKEKLVLGPYPFKVPEMVQQNKLVPIIEAHIKAARYPYWQWAPCLACERWRPPRCHHCKLCGNCILKRDHHCFFARNCVGLKNLRYFIVFLFYACIVTVFTIYHGVTYLWTFYWPEMSYLDLVPLLSFLRAILGSNTTLSQVGVMIIMAYGMFGLTFLSFMHFIDASVSVVRGNTAFEIENNIDVKDPRKFADKLRSVFGPHWQFAFVLPTPYFLSPSIEDPYHWSSLIPPKKRNPVIQLVDP
ncbi:palmitoyltransferase ZDHHC21-like [Saccostrea echinata]|uniref:palmitoyltransferase ZDHHC21-like n=1 Tax=Saccostrea echinata TaxID=191078 RepID=UPI002A8379E7|nr:palmitoyltransferase ZDHHC21-like [Saccostrea echinata]